MEQDSVFHKEKQMETPQDHYEYKEIKRSDHRKSNQFALIHIEYIKSKLSSTGFMQYNKKCAMIYKDEDLANLICSLLNTK